jgi:hypothetical protein
MFIAMYLQCRVGVVRSEAGRYSSCVPFLVLYFGQLPDALVGQSCNGFRKLSRGIVACLLQMGLNVAVHGSL